MNTLLQHDQPPKAEGGDTPSGEAIQAGAMASSNSSGALSPAPASFNVPPASCRVPVAAQDGAASSATALTRQDAGGTLQTHEKAALEMLCILMLTFNRRLIRQQITPDVMKSALKHGWLDEQKGPGRWDHYYVPAGKLEELIGGHGDAGTGRPSPTHQVPTSPSH